MVLNRAASVMYMPAPDVARVASSSLFALRSLSSDSSPSVTDSVVPPFPADAIPPIMGAPSLTLLQLCVSMIFVSHRSIPSHSHVG